MVFNLHFIDYCNYHCKHCFVKKEGKELSIDNIKTIIDKIAFYQQKHNEKVRVNIAGGEPLLSKNIQQIIDYIYSKGLDISIITNGYYLSEDFILKNNQKVSMIGISVDSLNEETNLLIGRCQGNKMLSKERLITLCKIIKDNGIKLKINTCITSLNNNEDINELLDTIKPDRVKVLRAFCHGDTEKYNITDNEWDIVKSKYNNAIFEDNDYMKTSYIIVDSTGNLSKNNLHITNNSLLLKNVKECLDYISHSKEEKQ